MAKITRYAGNLDAFASTAEGTERTVFGSATQSDNLTDNVNADFLRGWESGVTPEGYPPKQYFNAVGFTVSQLLAYIHQIGVAEYDAAQVYYTNSFCNYSGKLYRSLTDTNTGNTPDSSPTEWQSVEGDVLAILANATAGSNGALLIGMYNTVKSLSTTVAAMLNDQEQRITVLESSYHTGRLSYTYAGAAIDGWIHLDDGTIGNASSNATTRANADCEALFTLLWNLSPEGWCQIFDDSGNPVAKGLTAAVDWAANRQIETPKVIDRHLMTSAADSTIKQAFIVDTSGGSTSDLSPQQPGATSTAAARYENGMPVTLTTTDTLPAPLAPSTTYYVARVGDTTIHLYPTAADIVANTNVIVCTTDGVGTHTIHMPTMGGRGVCTFGGWNKHLQLTPEMPEHEHDYDKPVSQNLHEETGTSPHLHAINTAQTQTAGGSQAFTIMNPFATAFLILKL